MGKPLTEALELLNALISEGEKFNFENFCLRPRTYTGEFGGDDSAQWLTWKIRSYNIVCELTADNSPNRNLVAEGRDIKTRGNYPEEFLRAKEMILLALRLTLKAMEDDRFGELATTKALSSSPILSNRVFVVHGHDHALKDEIENFLHRVGLEPIVLHRQPNMGRTIIEKFEAHSDVGYVFILLTPDDIAYADSEHKLEDSARKKEKRARQNVIFEFGYFVGKLARSRVCCLYKGDVTLPSDLDGLVYKKVTESVDALGMDIIRELKAAGYTLVI